MSEYLLSDTEAANILGLCKDTVRHLRLDGTLDNNPYRNSMNRRCGRCSLSGVKRLKDLMDNRREFEQTHYSISQMLKKYGVPKSTIFNMHRRGEIDVITKPREYGFLKQTFVNEETKRFILKKHEQHKSHLCEIESETLTRKCPKCGKLLKYKNRTTRMKSDRLKSLCKVCFGKKTIAKYRLTKEAIEKSSMSRTGVAQTGLSAANQNNINAISGYFRDPCGNMHRFRNVSHFVRENEHLFLAEDVQWKNRTARNKNGTIPRSKTCRALVGLLGLTRKNPTKSWKGWTVGSMVDSVCFQGTDPLDRKA